MVTPTHTQSGSLLQLKLPGSTLTDRHTQRYTCFHGDAKCSIIDPINHTELGEVLTCHCGLSEHNIPHPTPPSACQVLIKSMASADTAFSPGPS